MFIIVYNCLWPWKSCESPLYTEFLTGVYLCFQLGNFMKHDGFSIRSMRGMYMNGCKWMNLHISVTSVRISDIIELRLRHWRKYPSVKSVVISPLKRWFSSHVSPNKSSPIHFDRAKGPKLRRGTAACDSTSYEVGRHVWREEGRLTMGAGWRLEEVGRFLVPKRWD